jgi:hypothetical protein
MAGSKLDELAPADTLYCINHPKRATLLRCNKCLQPICTQCAVRTPVGMRCPACARRNRSPLYVARPQHYAVAVVVALVLSLVAGALAAQLGLWIAFFLAAPVGAIIAEGVLRTTKKRGRAMQVITAVCIALGAYAGPWLWAVVSYGSLKALPGNPFAYLSSFLNLNSLLYAVLAIGAAVARLR